LLAPCPTPKLEERLLSTVQGALCNISSATPPQYPRDLLHHLKPEEPCHGDREPPTFQDHKEELVTQIWYSVGYVACVGNPINEATI